MSTSFILVFFSTHTSFPCHLITTHFELPIDRLAIMPSLSTALDPKAAHILAYGTLIGSTLFQSFLAGPIAYKAIPRPNFSQLQQAVTPPFFALQSVLPLVMALTWPGTKPAGMDLLREHVGARGLLHASTRWIAAVPFAVMFVAGAVNLAVLGPATVKVMRERKHQETKEGKKYYDPGPKSAEMQKLNNTFATIHGLSASIDLVAFGAMVWYGLVLAEML